MSDEILHRLTTLYPKAIEPGLERTLRILEDLGNPHLKLPPVIHIAGTNGKGSTLAFIRAMLEADQKTTHVMTSPHLVKFNERLVIAGHEISDDDLQSLLLRVEKLNAGQGITFFEITTAAGLLAFAENKADYCLLETGMGGRLDSTNVVPDPAVTIITNISLDHTQHLGDTLAKIAFEKAGIMKTNIPCVIGQQTEQAVQENIMSVFEARAKELNVPLYRYGHEWSYIEKEDGFTVTFMGKNYDCPKPNLLGHHQYANAATAVAALLAMKTNPALSGLTKAQWPARLQKIESGPLFDLLPEGWELYLDGGHNEQGGKILADQAHDWQSQDGKPLHLILGMLTTKDPKPFYDHLKPYITSATAIPIPDEKLAFTAEDLAENLNINKAPNARIALSYLPREATGRVLICGSLYLAGNIITNSNY